jgi:hypothetical protein
LIHGARSVLRVYMLIDQAWPKSTDLASLLLWLQYWIAREGIILSLSGRPDRLTFVAPLHMRGDPARTRVRHFRFSSPLSIQALIRLL